MDHRTDLRGGRRRNRIGRRLSRPTCVVGQGIEQDRHAVAVNQRGYSPGARPDGIDAYRTPLLVDDVLAIAAACGADRFHLVGHDWGGQIAWLVAAGHADRLRSLAVLSRPHPAAFARAWKEDPEQPGRSKHHRAFQDPESARLLLEDGARRLRRSLTDQGVPDGTVDAYVATLSDPGALDAALNWYRAMTFSTATTRQSRDMHLVPAGEAGNEAVSVFIDPAREVAGHACIERAVAFRSHAAHTLSGGQKQLLALSGVLAREPSHLVLDEPTTLLDLKNKLAVERAIDDLDATVICISHDLDFLRRFERILVFEAGRLAFDGAPAEALDFYVASQTCSGTPGPGRPSRSDCSFSSA